MQKQTKQRSTYNTVSRIRETEKKKEKNNLHISQFSTGQYTQQQRVLLTFNTTMTKFKTYKILN